MISGEKTEKKIYKNKGTYAPLYIYFIVPTKKNIYFIVPNNIIGKQNQIATQESMIRKVSIVVCPNQNKMNNNDGVPVRNNKIVQ